MLTAAFNYHLPKNLIAQQSIRPRDSSRLLVYERKTGKVRHQHFYDLPKFLKKGDLLVFNDTKVFKARLLGEGVEIFLLRPRDQFHWQVLAKPGRKLKIGGKVVLSGNLFCEVKEKKADGVIIVKFNRPSQSVLSFCQKYGHIPAPPYIKKEPSHLSDYQTIYAKNLGSVAAPTAGFHFTPSLIEKLKKMGVKTMFVTLHVGLGTFRPVKTKKVAEHQMHSEWAEISASTAAAINQAKKEGRRVVAVGTTTVRALEGAAGSTFRGDINLFITPGFKFRVIDGLITNFHLPQSTLLMLVAAFIGNRYQTLNIYQQAIALHYRFYSFGDAMLII